MPCLSASKAGWQICPPCRLPSPLVVAARSAELRKVLEVYLVYGKERHGLLASSAVRAKEEGFDLSSVTAAEFSCSINSYHKGSRPEG